MITFTIDEARVLVDAVENQRNSGPPDAEGFIGRTPVDPERLPDYVAARKADYAAAALRRAHIERRFAEMGAEYSAPEPLTLGEGVDMDDFVARLRALSPEERSRIVVAIQQMPAEELDEDGNMVPEAHYMRFTYQYLSEAGLIARPARPFEVVGYWYECTWRAPRDELEIWDGEVVRCYEHLAGPFATWDEAWAVAKEFGEREWARNPTLWRKRFQVRDIRDRYSPRESLQHGPEELAELLPPEQRTPHE